MTNVISMLVFWQIVPNGWCSSTETVDRSIFPLGRRTKTCIDMPVLDVAFDAVGLSLKYALQKNHKIYFISCVANN